jgi:hypothetical protein
MQFLKTLVIILLNMIYASAIAQQQGPTIQFNRFGEITNLRDAKFNRVIEETFIPNINENKIPYSRITGSRFWNNDWQSAALYQNSSLLGIVPLKLNLATNEVHVLIKDEEKVLQNPVTSIIFFKQNDTSITTAAFISYVPNLFLDNKKLNDFVQVLNYGDYQLLKYVKRKVSVGDSLFRTLKRYYFSDDRYYFLKSGEKVERIKKLSKDNVLAFLPSSSKFYDWIKENNIDFKRETDVIRFLNYYNAVKRQ